MQHDSAKRIAGNLSSAPVRANLPVRVERRQCVDIHCHCLPGLDDGPRTMLDALALCESLVTDGVSTVIATPHQLGRYDGLYDCDRIRSVVADLNEVLQQEELPLRVLPGADVRIDERICDMLNRSEVMTLADGGRYLLLELPARTYIDPLPILRELAESGVTVILSHPERHEYLLNRPNAVIPWLAEGMLLQISAGSVIGALGSAARNACRRWLEMGAISLVASDAHDTVDRPPCLTQAMAKIGRDFGYALAKSLCLDNPYRVLCGTDTHLPEMDEPIGEAHGAHTLGHR